MTGWCPYIDGTLKETECHHDGYCSDCPYKKDDDNKETLTQQSEANSMASKPMIEQVAYSYYDTAGNYIWCGTMTGVHVIRKKSDYGYPVITTQSEAKEKKWTQ